MLSTRIIMTLLAVVIQSAAPTNSEWFKAIEERDVAAVETLLAKGANVNAKKGHGETALMIAAKNGDAPITSLLLAHGADVNAKAKRGETALFYAFLNGHESIEMALLGKTSETNVVDDDGNTLLMFASFYGHLAIARSLLEIGGDINATNSEGETALMWAAKAGQDKMIDLLLSKGARVDARTRGTRGRSPHGLGYTIMFRVPGRICKECKNWGPNSIPHILLDGILPTIDVTCPGDSCFWVMLKGRPTALHMAAFAGHAGSVKALLAGGAEINAKTDTGYTALMMSAITGGYNPRSWDDLQRSLFLAPETYMRKAQGDDAEVAEALLSAGADVKVTAGSDKSKAFSGQTALHFAARDGNERVVKALLKKGADVNAKDVDGQTALMCALPCRQQLACVNNVRMLLEAGADITIKDNKGRTALKMSEKEPEISRLLSGAKQ